MKVEIHLFSQKSSTPAIRGRPLNLRHSLRPLKNSGQDRGLFHLRREWTANWLMERREVLTIGIDRP